MLRKIAFVAAAISGLATLAAAPAQAADTPPCPPGTVRVVAGQFCFGGLFSTETCQDIAACKRIIVHMPHKPVGVLMPPPHSRPFPGPARDGHPRLKFR
jgi:hypothetical protein